MIWTCGMKWKILSILSLVPSITQLSYSRPTRLGERSFAWALDLKRMRILMRGCITLLDKDPFTDVTYVAKCLSLSDLKINTPRLMTIIIICFLRLIDMRLESKMSRWEWLAYSQIVHRYLLKLLKLHRYMFRLTLTKLIT